ncbi:MULTISPECIES: hypothetical protein [Vagococcus]|nr:MULTISPECIES: hypothetical protein [Vagococcus]HCM90756.1 hypothetical protein [Vagococcus sp.]
MNNKKIDPIEVVVNSIDLWGATKALKEFVSQNFSEGNPSLTELAALQGLVACIEVMAQKNSDEVTSVLG